MSGGLRARLEVAGSMALVVVAALGLLSSICSPALSRGLTDAMSWRAPDGKTYRVGIYFMDGLFGPDPARPVVVDDQNRFVAIGPLVRDGVVSCTGPDSCTILLAGSTLMKVAPDPVRFQHASQQHPETMEREFEAPQNFGFERRWLSPLDYFTALTIGIRRAPLTAMLYGGIFMVLTAVAAGCAAALSRLWRQVRKRPLGFVAAVLLALPSWYATLVLLFADLVIAGPNLFYAGPMYAAIGISAVVAWRTMRRAIPPASA